MAALLSPGVRGAVGRLTPLPQPPLLGLLAGIATVVLTFAVLTGVLAAQRISRIDPQEALRDG